MDDYFLCPHCGAELPASATFCRECGSSEDSGWNKGDEHARDDDFDYDEYVAREFPQHASASAKLQLRNWFVVLVVLVLALLILLASLRPYP